MHKVTWKGPRAAMEAAATLLEEAFGETAQAVGLQRLDAPLDDGDDGEWSVEAYFETPPDLDTLHEAILSYDPAFQDAASGVVEELPEKDWVAHSLEGLGVVEAGRFVLYGVHDEEKLPSVENIIPIRIDANQAFGTGHHPTTKGCLDLLDRLGDLPAERVFDLGCGSGVLAFAAAKAWGVPVLAADIDETSIEIAKENARLNRIDDAVTLLAAAGFDHPDIQARAPFDFVFANILAGPLKELAPEMAIHVARHGRVMLAGLMGEQEAGVTEAYEANGFRRINRLDHNTWPILLFVKL